VRPNRATEPRSVVQTFCRTLTYLQATHMPTLIRRFRYGKMEVRSRNCTQQEHFSRPERRGTTGHEAVENVSKC
jgi:hypothetical protein